jgi:hypothetical protein
MATAVSTASTTLGKGGQHGIPSVTKDIAASPCNALRDIVKQRHDTRVAAFFIGAGEAAVARHISVEDRNDRARQSHLPRPPKSTGGH